MWLRMPLTKKTQDVSICNGFRIGIMGSMERLEIKEYNRGYIASIKV